MACYLYIAISDDSRFCKIGCTGNPSNRAYQLRREALLKCGSKVEMVALWPTQSWGDERKLLDRFEAHAITPKGEWFNAHPEILEYARSMPFDESLIVPKVASRVGRKSNTKEKVSVAGKLYCPLCREEATSDHIRDNDECSRAIASLAARYRVSKRRVAVPGTGRGNRKGI